MTRRQILLKAVRRDSSSFFRACQEDSQCIFSALVFAEDHRAKSHIGIDWRSLARAMLLYPKRRRLTGVSTIEQQYVRTVIPRRGNLIRCKIIELLDAYLLARNHKKEDIWAAYLWRAYYGAYMNGYVSARREFLPDDEPLTIEIAAKIVACLKYPRPKNPSSTWQRKHSARVEYILSRIE